MEIWKDIKGYEGLYQVSSEGRVKSLKYGKEKILKSGKNSGGYLKVQLCKEGKIRHYLVHKLVAQAFIPNPNNKPFIDHINTIKTDNRVENLRWCTQKENQNNPITKIKFKNNYKPCLGKFGKSHPVSKPILQFTLDGELVRKWDSITDAEKEIGFCHSNISKCCEGKRKSAFGYIWKYYYKGIWLKKHIPLIKQKRKKVA